MSLDDFCRLTPEEFAAVCAAYSESAEGEMQGEWERMRLHAAIVIQPHIKNKITPSRLVPLPWDGSRRKGERRQPTSAEEDRRRFDNLMKRTHGQASTIQH